MSTLHLGFSEPATHIMEGIIDLHNNIMIYLIFILVLVLWFFFSILYNFWYIVNHPSNSFIMKTHRGDMRRFRPFSHHSSLEILWTVLPSCVLVSIAIPSFEMLYNMELDLDSAYVIKVNGHQWYWSYGYSIDISDVDPVFSFDSNIVFDEDLLIGDRRLLKTDKPLVGFVDVPVHYIITSTDVLHSWSIPSLGIKCDAVPGRLNQVFSVVKREGIFYGQCSELCGVNHGFMPIEMEIMAKT